jgi:hypothetical protein
MKSVPDSYLELLEDCREKEADRTFEDYNFGEDSVCDHERWLRDGPYWSKVIYLEHEDIENTTGEEQSSAKAVFGLEFADGTNKVLDTWVEIC